MADMTLMERLKRAGKTMFDASAKTMLKVCEFSNGFVRRVVLGVHSWRPRRSLLFL